MRVTDVYSADQTDAGVELRKVGEGLGCLKCDTPFVATRTEVFPKPMRVLQKAPPAPPSRDMLKGLESMLNTGEE